MLTSFRTFIDIYAPNHSFQTQGANPDRTTMRNRQMHLIVGNLGAPLLVINRKTKQTNKISEIQKIGTMPSTPLNELTFIN